MKFYHREPTEKLIASSNFNSLSASFCCALTLSYRPCKHLTQLLFWLLFLWADGEIPWCVFCQLVCCLPSVRRSPGKDQTVIYKSPLWWTVRVEACPAIHPSVSKSFASLFDVPAPQCCWVWCPQLFFAFIPCQSSWYQSRVCINKCSPVCLKWFVTQEHSASQTRLQNRGRMLIWVIWRWHTQWQKKVQMCSLCLVQ